MASNVYSGIKDADTCHSFHTTQWLTPSQLLETYLITSQLIYPNEKVFNDKNELIDILLLASQFNKAGNIKLKTILLSQLSSTSELFILKLPKDSYFWCNADANVIPRHSLRVGYDQTNRQFSYIGRMNVSDLVVGTLTHIYEYIPAIVLQLHDKDVDLNFISTDYQVLCIRRQPITLKQACTLQLNQMNEASFTANQPDTFLAFAKLPNSIKQILWPSQLKPGQCLLKNTKMRSANSIFEININKGGILKFVQYSLDSSSLSRRCATHEKNLECLLVSETGVYLIYDNNQAMRKPHVMYKHAARGGQAFCLELSDLGLLGVIRSNSVVIPLLSLSDSFRSIVTIKKDDKVDEKRQDLISWGVLENVIMELQGWASKVVNYLGKMVKLVFGRSISSQTVRN